MAASRRSAQSVKSTLTYVGLLHRIFEHAVWRGWAASNLCTRVEKPKARDVDADVLFLDQAELEEPPGERGGVPRSRCRRFSGSGRSSAHRRSADAWLVSAL